MLLRASKLAVTPRAVLELTPRQRQIYDYTRQCIDNRGYGPTVREIADHLHVRSLSAVRRHLRHLERSGYVRCEAFSVRAFQLAPLGRGCRGRRPAAGTCGGS